MKFYVPEISDEIRLLADWEFDFYNEYRNDSLNKFLNVGLPMASYSSRNDPKIPVIIPAGSILAIDRIYIRKGQKDFSSITFRWKGMSNPSYFEDQSDYRVIIVPGSAGVPAVYGTKKVKVAKEAIRFWAKLEDVNKIEFEKV